MKKTIEIQDIYVSEQDARKYLSYDIEVTEQPTTPLLHQMSRFWFINEGKGTVRLQDRDYELTKDCVVSVLPWQITDIIRVDEPLRYEIVEYDFDSARVILKNAYGRTGGRIELMEALSAYPVVRLPEDRVRDIADCFHSIAAEAGVEMLRGEEKTDLYHDLYLRNKLVELIILFLRAGHAAGGSGGMRAQVIEKSDILHYMYRHLSEKITLTSLSQLFYMSESAISDYIRATTGLSFFDLLNEMRIGKMMNYLKNTDFSLEELAMILGYVDSSHISRTFESFTGMKANEYRRTYQNVERLAGIHPDKRNYRIVEFIYENYRSELTAAAVAEHFGITVSALNAVLLDQVEKNYSLFVNYLRINEACRLLKETELGILDIAVSVGYHNIKTFNRNFLFFRQMTPGVFRNGIELQGVQQGGKSGRDRP